MKRITLFALIGCLLYSYLGWTQKPEKTIEPTEVVKTFLAAEDQTSRPKKARKAIYRSTRMTSDEVGTELIRSPDHRVGLSNGEDSLPPLGSVPRYRMDTITTDVHLPARRTDRRVP